MGLLDALNSDDGRLALGLLAAAGPSAVPQSFGQRLYGAMSQFNEGKKADEDRKMRQQMLQIQMQELLAQADERKRLREKEAGTQAAFTNAFRTPAQMAVGAHGPTHAAANAIESTAPGFDRNALIQGLVGVNPQKAFELAQPPERKFTTVGDNLVDITQGRDPRAVFTAAPKPEAQPSAVREYQFAKQQGYPGTFQQFQLEQKRAGATNLSVGMNTPVQGIGPDGNPAFVVIPKDGGAPVTVPGVRPPKSAAEERAEAEKRERLRQSEQMVSAMADARRILQQGRATESGIGNVVDQGARMFGATTSGAQDAARLEALSGWLVANVPRMEGPQSNYDVENYKTMAGMVGDRTRPIKERLAALSEVEKLQRKYANINGTPLREPTGKQRSLSDLLGQYGGDQ